MPARVLQPRSRRSLDRSAGLRDSCASPAWAQQVPVEGQPVAEVRVVDETGQAGLRADSAASA